MTVTALIKTRQAMEFDAVPVVMMAHDLASHHGDTAALRLNAFLKDACGANPRCHVFIAETAAREIAGFAACYFTYEFQHGVAGLEVQNFFIRPAFREQGTGKRLMHSLARFAVRHDCGRISLGALTSNQEAIAFYSKIGFEKRKTGGDVQRFFLEGDKLLNFIGEI